MSDGRHRAQIDVTSIADIVVKKSHLKTNESLNLSRRPANTTEKAPSLDTVAFYFQKMARVPLLTREGEIDLARRIEASERSILASMLGTKTAAPELIAIAKEMRAGKLGVQDVVRNVNEDDVHDQAMVQRLARVIDRAAKLANEPTQKGRRTPVHKREMQRVLGEGDNTPPSPAA